MKRLKRYLLFCGDAYYPQGGWDDFKESFNSLAKAINFAAKMGPDWSHVVDSKDGQIVWSIKS